MREKVNIKIRENFKGLSDEEVDIWVCPQTGCTLREVLTSDVKARETGSDLFVVSCFVKFFGGQELLFKAVLIHSPVYLHPKPSLLHRPMVCSPARGQKSEQIRICVGGYDQIKK